MEKRVIILVSKTDVVEGPERVVGPVGLRRHDGDAVDGHGPGEVHDVHGQDAEKRHAAQDVDRSHSLLFLDRESPGGRLRPGHRVVGFVVGCGEKPDLDDVAQGFGRCEGGWCAGQVALSVVWHILVHHRAQGLGVGSVREGVSCNCRTIGKGNGRHWRGCSSQRVIS